ncbi:unnamed protein product [Linum tenue]|uniref:DUF4220 domain-containing protein n=1 Tax=Linum tenue TaxID=586396 RepID=A0AAV0IK34_9ROSI|nr:unnamed protein product [Linum tenue]
MSEIVDIIKILCSELNIRSAVLGSLCLQISLILASPSRRWTRCSIIIFFIWLAYVVADMVAIYAIGLISKTHHGNQSDDSGDASSSSPSPELLSFWAPFLLVHLGGPDTITAFSLEDNQLWRRHLTTFFMQAGTILYFFYLSLPNNRLKFPTSLMFLSGCVKYLERTRSMYLASKNKFRDDMNRDVSLQPDHDQTEKYAKKWQKIVDHPEVIAARTVRQQEEQEEPLLSELDVLKRAGGLLEIEQALLADMILGLPIRDSSRKLFEGVSARDALRVLEVELGFTYRVLYTKFQIVRSAWGRIARVLAVAAVLLALSSFHLNYGSDFDDIDVTITYTLLFGALALEALAILKSSLFDPTTGAATTFRAWWRKHVVAGCCEPFFWAWLRKLAVVVFYKPFLHLTGRPEEATPPEGRPVISDEWCGSVSGFNLMTYSLRRYEIGSYLPRLVQDQWLFKSSKPLREDLWEFIYLELKEKSNKYVTTKDLDSVRKACSVRGEGVMEKYGLDKGCIDLMPSVVNIPYDESLLLWHVATELLYNNASDESQGREPEYKEFSKTLSDYLLYLLVMQPAMMSTVSGFGKVRFEDTCSKVRKLFGEWGVGSNQIRSAYKKLLNAKPEFGAPAASSKGSDSNKENVVLFTASRLAKELQKLGTEKWEVVGKVWVELLSYAAINCDKTAHAQQLSKGGELITFVWLMMAHLGLSVQFQEDAYVWEPKGDLFDVEKEAELANRP